MDQSSAIDVAWRRTFSMVQQKNTKFLIVDDEQIRSESCLINVRDVSVLKCRLINVATLVVYYARKCLNTMTN